MPRRERNYIVSPPPRGRFAVVVAVAVKTPPSLDRTDLHFSTVIHAIRNNVEALPNGIYEGVPINLYAHQASR